MVLSLVLGSTTIKADSIFTYTYYVTLENGQSQIWKSDAKVTKQTASGKYFYNPNSGEYIERASSTENVWCTDDYTPNACILTYNGEDWVYSVPSISCGTNMSDLYATVFASNNMVVSTSTTAPAGFPEVNEEDIQEIINSELNGTTEITTQANVYITNITQVYNNYTAGNITLEDAKAEVESNVDSLSDLAQEPTATLKDAITVQNGLTYGQIVNDTLLQEQEEAYWNERDIDAEVSQEIQNSSQEEIDYLTDLAETAKKISELDDGIDDESVQQIQSVVSAVWEMEFFKKILPVVAILLVISVALGVKFRL